MTGRVWIRALWVVVIALLLMGHVAEAQGLGLDLGGIGGGKIGANAKAVAARAVMSAEPIAVGKEAAILIEVKIDGRFHIQGADAPQPYIAAQVKLPVIKGVTFGEVEYAPSQQVAAPAGYPGPPTIPVYEGTVYLKVPVTVDADYDAAGGGLELKFVSQACDARTCQEPTTLPLKVALKVGEKEGAAPDAALAEAAGRQKYITVAPREAATGTAAVPPGAVGGTTEPGVALLSTQQELALIAARPYQAANPTTYSAWEIILLGLLGGVVLNVMPCVLPVIPLKVMSLVQHAHGDRRLAVLHSLAFAAGVITLFVALAIALRTLGLFYGQQFQSAGFLVAMILFVVALALSMLGVWTINPPQALYAVDAKIAEATAEPLNYAGTKIGGAARDPRSAYLGSFANGLMATLLATPCSAPFLGGVLAWALVRPVWVAALTLGWVGVGMSLPYLILAAFPALLNRFPRTGRWSELLKQGLGIVMLGVAVYLVSLIQQVQLWPFVMLGAVVVALVCWGWGQIPTVRMEARRVWQIRIVCVVIGAMLGAGVFVLASRTKEIMFTQQAEGNWQPFNVGLLDKALADGRPVVVDWTASWCINCHALDALVLSRDSVQKEFANSNAVLLRADESVTNETAKALRGKLGGQGIPVLAIFTPRNKYEPVVLLDGYTTEGVIGEVEKAR